MHVMSCTSRSMFLLSGLFYIVWEWWVLIGSNVQNKIPIFLSPFFFYETGSCCIVQAAPIPLFQPTCVKTTGTPCSGQLNSHALIAPAILALRRLQWEDCGLEASLRHRMESYPQTNKQAKTQKYSQCPKQSVLYKL